MSTKMSKSSGNAINVDEAVYGVYSISEGHRFCDINNNIVDWKVLCVWRKGNKYFTAKRFGLIPVFLCIN